MAPKAIAVVPCAFIVLPYERFQYKLTSFSYKCPLAKENCRALSRVKLEGRSAVAFYTISHEIKIHIKVAPPNDFAEQFIINS